MAQGKIGREEGHWDSQGEETYSHEATKEFRGLHNYQNRDVCNWERSSSSLEINYGVSPLLCVLMWTIFVNFMKVSEFLTISVQSALFDLDHYLVQLLSIFQLCYTMLCVQKIESN